MSGEGVGVLATSAQNGAVESPTSVRRSADYQPSVWGHHFLAYASDHHSPKIGDAKEQQLFQKLKEEVRRLLAVTTTSTHSEMLYLIDVIQRLGVSYHFEIEIDQALKKFHDTFLESIDGDNDDDLESVALRFRLLRQQGYFVSCEVFNKFKDNKGSFKESLVSNVRGILSLYEATHLRIRGEDVLDEALTFTTSHLESLATHLSTPLVEQVKHALKQPIHKGLQRLEARRYMPIYQKEKSHNKDLLMFAKLDFNLLQKVHQRELGDITKWWKDLDFANKLSFGRDRVVECYFWILGVYFEPQYSLARRILTKVIAMTSFMDDIYDVYGTLEELELLTNAIERWDISALDQLPEYMKVYYQALLDVYIEIKEEMIKEERLYRMYYVKEAMKSQARVYLAEAKWFDEKHMPTMEEYMRLALLTSGYPMLAMTSLVGMGDIVTKDTFEWIVANPNIVTASSIICRLMDDMVSHKFEQKRGHVVSAVECYMNEYGVSEKDAQDEFDKQVTNAWKDINEECLPPTTISMIILKRIINLARVMDVLYKNEDAYTNAGTMLKDLIASLLIDPVPVL
ncbi:(-)-germacrene D synthase-like [Malania oleifera]|uniref:(-)-germacrene D synthase-like n=1 Tax=Malania oleifera TaxID=397392 RepID=UPI0025AE0736|nr:(-)-germacrene D synthase-like [Malania oleifera]